LPVLSFMPEVDNIIGTSFKHGELKLQERYRLGKELRQQKFDQAIVLPYSWKSALIPCFAKIPKRTGWLGEMRFGLLNDWRRLDEKRYSMMIKRYAALAFPSMQLLPELPLPRLVVDKNLPIGVCEKLGLKTDRPILGLCPGAEYGPSKRWPPKHFAKVAKTKLQEGWQVYIFGGKNDENIANEIQLLTENKCVNLAGKTTLPESIAIMSLANCIVSNDSGLLHIGAALDRPMIAIYGATAPTFAPPLCSNAKSLSLNLPCSPCVKKTCRFGHYKCLNDLMPETVLNEMEKIK
jgi:heptosyltransferase II